MTEYQGKCNMQWDLLIILAALTAAITAISTMEFPMYCETGPLTDVQQVHVSLILFSYYLICIFLHLNIYEIGKRGK